MQVSCSPIARATSVAATAESTPPESAQMTLSLPTRARISSTDCSRNDSIFQSCREACDLAQEVLQNDAAVLRVHDLRMELNAVDLLLRIAHRGDVTTRGRSQRAIPFWQSDAPSRHATSRRAILRARRRRAAFRDRRRSALRDRIRLDRASRARRRHRERGAAYRNRCPRSERPTRQSLRPSPARPRPSCSRGRRRESTPRAHAARASFQGVSCGTISQ